LAAMNGRTARARRRKAESRLVANSGLFDGEWYLRNYPDVAEAGTDPLRHFMTCGWQEGRDPGPEFATSAYLRANSDVARSGINPLLHYIEFGHAEGRGTFGHRVLIQSRASRSFDFAGPAPCSSFPRAEERPRPWLRAYRLDRERPDALEIGNVPLGYCSKGPLRREVESGLELFARLSASERPASQDALKKLTKTEFELADGWYLNSSQLRTRWTGKVRQFVVRALQHDPLRGGALALAGEGLVSSPLDVVDFQLRDAFYPLLFIFCDLDGAILGCRLLAFPSLCRGGAHYPELISAAEIDAGAFIDPLSYSEALAGRLLALLDGDAEPALGQISYELVGTDGAAPLLQPRMRGWLEKILRVAVEVSSSAETRTPSSRKARDLLRKGALGIRLSHDMVPTIAALTEPRSAKVVKVGEAIVPLVVAGHDPAMPVSLVDVPRHMTALLGELEAPGGGTWPRLVAGKSAIPLDFPPAAIRACRDNGPSDAELLVPVADPALPSALNRREAITWVVEASGWHEGDLFLAIHSLGMQAGADHDALAVVGQVDRATLSMAKERFEGRAALFRDLKAAALGIDTPLAAFIGPGTMLHDPRTALELSRLLGHQSVETASCVLIRGEKPGRSWHAAGLDLGAMAGRIDGRPTDHDGRALAGLLWRTVYPVASPVRDLWLTRTANARAWIGNRTGKTIAGYHLCSFMVTASNVGCERPAERSIVVPQAPSNHSLNVRANAG